MAGTNNPYAPPQAELAGGGLRDALFRDGKVLVAAREAAFPARCIRCNAAAGTRTYSRKLRWTPPVWSSLYAFGLLMPVHPAFGLGLLAALIMTNVKRRSAEVEYPLCARHARRLEVGRIVLYGGIAVMLPLFAWAFMSLGGTTLYYRLPPEGAMAVFACVFPWGIFVGLSNRTITAKKITDATLHLGGCGEAFLASLPTLAATKRD